MTTSVTIITSDNNTFFIPREAAMISNILASSLEDEDEDEDQQYPLPLTFEKLRPVVDFLIEYSKRPYDSDFINGKLDNKEYQFYIDFVNRSFKELYLIAETANFLDATPLYNILLAKMSQLTKNKTIEQLSVIVDIPMDKISTRSEEDLESSYPWVKQLLDSN